MSGDRRGGRILETLLGTIQRLVKSHVIDGLEQIVERAEFECRHCIVVERGDEDHRRHFIGTHFGDHVEAVQLGHLHVEKNQVRLIGANGGDCLQSILTLANNLDVGNARQQRAEPLPSQRFVVDDENAHRLIHHELAAAASLLSNGAPFRGGESLPSL